jgi:hypothetical protein
MDELLGLIKGIVADRDVDPREAARFWKVMAIQAGGDAHTNFFWSSHDNNTTRRSYLISEFAVNYKGVDFDSLKKDSPEFQHIRGVVLGAREGKIRVKVRKKG